MSETAIVDVEGLPSRLVQFFLALQEKNKTDFKERYPHNPSPVFDLIEGPRFYYIVQKYVADEKPGRAYAFIDRINGNILRPANHRTPTKHVGGNIFSADFGLRCCDVHGVSY